LDMERWEYIDHEIRQIAISECEVNSLLRVLKKVQNSNHDMCARWKTWADQERWRKHIQDISRIISQLK